MIDLDLDDGATALGGLAPEALRAMSVDELVALAARLRGFLVDAVARTGGHLGANLGVVELTLALHRTFESPRDAIVWDTGHQAYAHKVVTGRADQFATLRQADGLSGYPNRSESAHDLVENSHASTALSYASGIAAARRRLGAPGRVVAVVGDGSLTGGVAYEALNNLAVRRDNVLVVLNDNGRSYAPTISPLTAAGGSDHAGRRARAFFGALGIECLGPIDGHDVGALLDALAELAARPGPVVLHVLTRKGKGYGPAERDEDRCLHDVGRFDVESGAPVRVTSSARSYTETFGAAMLDVASRHDDVVAITAAMGSPTGLRAFAEKHPDRYFDVGIAEQHAVNVAAGMAMGGLRPVVAIYSTFLNRAWDQLYYDVGLHQLPIVLCLDRAGVTGDDGPSHHGVLDLMLLAKVPGMTVLAPSSAEELTTMLHHALDHVRGPVALRWPKSPAPSSDAVGHGLRARRIREGGAVCLIGVGKLVAACDAAADLLGEAGVGATVWDARSVVPIDEHLLADAATHDLVVTVEDGIVDGGFGARVRDSLVLSGSSRVVTCGVPTAYLPHGEATALLSSLGLDAAGIARTVLASLEGPRDAGRV